MKQRLYSLDFLRGFSLLGILLMNIVGFSHDIFHMNPFYMFQTGLNRLLYSLELLLINNSFYPIFAFLFGYGLAMMHDNALNRGDRFGPIVYRRLTAMIIFGMLHGMLIFSGDILQSYAFVSLLGALLLFVDKRWMLVTASGLFLLNVVQNMLPHIINALQRPNYDYLPNDVVSAQQMTDTFNSGQLSQIIAQTSANFFQYFFINDATSFLFRLTTLLPIILLGMYAQRSGWLERMAAAPQRFMVIGTAALLIGLAVKSLPLIFYGRYSLEVSAVYIGGVIVAAGYVILIVICCEQPLFRKLTQPVALLGRMSFTAYIMQSVMMFMIIYGLQLFSRMTLFETYGLAVMIYIFQLIFAVIYFRKFHQGPLELIWRRITYWN